MKELIKNPAIILALLGFIVYLIRLLLSNNVIEHYKEKDEFLNMVYLSYQDTYNLEKDTSCISKGISCSMLALIFFIAWTIFSVYDVNCMPDILFCGSIAAFLISAFIYIKYFKLNKPDKSDKCNEKSKFLFILIIIISYILITCLDLKNVLNKCTEAYIIITILLYALFIIYREKYIEYCIQNLKEKNINLKLFFGEQSFEINTGNIDIKHNYIRILDNDNYVTLKLEDISKIEVSS